jgi:carbon monoxide dehydrogenase subunit G
MARYVVHVQTPLPPDEAFAYMADLRNFAEWDPGVERVTQVKGEGHGPDTSFDFVVKSVGRSITLRYNTVEYNEPAHVVAFAESNVLSSRDTITVRADGTGSVVSYDAVLKLKGVFGLADPLLGLAFKRIGDRAAAGMIKALKGERTKQPA